MQVPLCLDNIGELDQGAARLIIDAAIRQAVADLDDRGEDGKTRQVVINLDLARMENGLTTCQVLATAKLPPRKTNATVALTAQKQGQPQLLFQICAPDDPRQRTIDEAQARAEGKDVS